MMAILTWPIVMLGGILIALVVTLAFDRRRRHRRHHALFALARESRMNYSPLDRFDLAGRLRRLPQWVADSTDLHVRDVLYAAGGTHRRFIATAVRRHTRDTPPTLFIVACEEGLTDVEFREVQSRVAVNDAPIAEAYRSALSRLAVQTNV